jgi:hypothetical protein
MIPGQARDHAERGASSGLKAVRRLSIPAQGRDDRRARRYEPGVMSKSKYFFMSAL